MTEVIDHRHSFISHRGHRGHRVLIWIAEGAIQIKLPSSYRWKFTPFRLGGSIWPDFYLLAP